VTTNKPPGLAPSPTLINQVWEYLYLTATINSSSLYIIFVHTIHIQYNNNNNNNNLIYKAPMCRGTAVALADNSNCVN